MKAASRLMVSVSQQNLGATIVSRCISMLHHNDADVQRCIVMVMSIKPLSSTSQHVQVAFITKLDDVVLSVVQRQLPKLPVARVSLLVLRTRPYPASTFSRVALT